LVAELQLSEEREKDVRGLFKKPAENPKILIVTDKLLTGYDAPRAMGGFGGCGSERIKAQAASVRGS
jgi:hypothetical protein